MAIPKWPLTSTGCSPASVVSPCYLYRACRIARRSRRGLCSDAAVSRRTSEFALNLLPEEMDLLETSVEGLGKDSA
jgi:hypothetical protein